MSDTLTTTPIDDKIEFVSQKDAERFERMMFKDYVRAKDGKPLAEAKKIIYRIVAVHPYEKAGMMCQTGKFLMQFEVQKFHRNQFRDIKTREGNETREHKDNAPVEQYRMNDAGTWECVDEEANRFIDSAAFEREFVPDQD